MGSQPQANSVTVNKKESLCTLESELPGLSNSNHKAPPRPFFHRFVGSGEARADKPTSFLGGMVMPTRRAGRELESPGELLKDWTTSEKETILAP